VIRGEGEKTCAAQANQVRKATEEEENPLQDVENAPREGKNSTRYPLKAKRLRKNSKGGEESKENQEERGRVRPGQKRKGRRFTRKKMR